MNLEYSNIRNMNDLQSTKSIHTKRIKNSDGIIKMLKMI